MRRIAHNLHDTVFNYMIKEIFEEEIYSFNTSRIKPTIIDCGANIGLSTIFFKEKYPESIIYSFEPNKEMYKFLEINTHNLQDVYIHQKAVGNDNKTTSFYIPNNSEDIFSPVSSLIKNEIATKETKVSMISFGEFVLNVGRVDFCKIDIEGGESMLLESLIKHQVLENINELTIEYHKWSMQKYNYLQFIEIMKSKNYNCTILREEDVNARSKYNINGNTILNFKKI